MQYWKKQGLIAMTALLGAIAGVTITRGSVLELRPLEVLRNQPAHADNREPSTTFFVTAGGGAPSYNEIALEKNVRYFQRTLAHMGWDPAIATTLFANGLDGQLTVRYLDFLGRERFKAPNIENLTGAATRSNVEEWFASYPQTAKGSSECPAFFYFTGHGTLNSNNPDNNDLILWGEDFLSVQELANMLDQWPSEVPFVTMMAQCYSGAFANLIYEGGNPSQPVALQTRCGFFATVKTRPSVGCTPLVNEADYRDYSSSFFAGLSGRDRVGEAVASADYNADDQVSFAEAHAFAKVDGETSDWPISTSEAWLQKQASETQVQEILATPIQTLLTQARPEQQYVIEALAQKLNYDTQVALADAPEPKPNLFGLPQDVLTAYRMRLQMELINVGTEVRLKREGNETAIATLNKLLECEARTW
ncbi:MAG: Caspase domain-containing protein [Cyanobacteria bacterium J06639_14]